MGEGEVAWRLENNSEFGARRGLEGRHVGLRTDVLADKAEEGQGGTRWQREGLCLHLTFIHVSMGVTWP